MPKFMLLWMRLAATALETRADTNTPLFGAFAAIALTLCRSAVAAGPQSQSRPWRKAPRKFERSDLIAHLFEEGRASLTCWVNELNSVISLPVGSDRSGRGIGQALKAARRTALRASYRERIS